MLRFTKKHDGEQGVFINKLAAAERQLAAAIRLYFLREDKLATHTVANAAYGIFSDLLSKRGKNEFSFPLEYGLVRLAFDIASGTIVDPTFLSELNAEGNEEIRRLIDAFRGDPSLSPDQVSIELVGDHELKSDWYSLRHPANFLKHADRDAARLLDSSTLETEEILIRAINSSLHLNQPLTKEKEYFYAAMYALGKLCDPPREPISIWVLMSFEPEEVMELGKRNLCGHLIASNVPIDFERAKLRMKNPFETHPPDE